MQDKQGNPIQPNQDGSGYTLQGPTTGSYSLTGTYPDVLNAVTGSLSTGGPPFLPDPSDYQGWLFTGAPGGYDRNHVWTKATAGNGAWFKNNAPPELINGGVTANVVGTLWAIWKWNPSPYPGSPQKPPDHLDILLSTSASASASVGAYGSPPSSAGLSSSATASDSLGHTVTATAPGNPSPPPVTGRKLLRVPVDPVTGLAPVSAGGTVMRRVPTAWPMGRWVITTTPHTS